MKSPSFSPRFPVPMRVLAASVLLAFSAIPNSARADEIDVTRPCIDVDLAGWCGRGHDQIDGHGFTVSGDGKLRLNGAADQTTTVQYLRAVQGGSVEASNLYIHGPTPGTGVNGVLVTAGDGGRLSLTDSTVISTDGAALWVGRQLVDSEANPSVAVLNNVSLHGVGRTASVSANSLLEMSGGEVIATRGEGRLNYAIQIVDSTLRAYGTKFVGADHALAISTERSPVSAGSEVILSSAHLESEDGAAIKIYREVGSVQDEFDVSLAILNGTTIKAGNGTLIEVGFNADGEDDRNPHPFNANITIDDSRLEGDIKFSDRVNSDLTLSNRAVVTGRIEGADRIHLETDGEWRLVEDSQTANVSMQGGIIDIHGTAAEGQYHTLEIGSLSGEGTFRMQTDLDAGEADRLHLTGGDSTGNFGLAVKNTGTEAKVDTQQLVQDDGGSATFSVVGGQVDLGAYAYVLEKEEIDGKTYWKLVRGEGPSSGTESIVGIFSALPTVWMGEASTLRTRLGDVRLAETKEGGAWARTFGNRYNASPSVGQGYRQDQYGVIAGADHIVGRNANGTWLVGGMAGTSANNLKFDVGSTGSIDSYTAGVYASWLGNNGYYFDTVFKYNRYMSELSVMMRDGVRSKGDYNSNGFGISAEFGRKMTLTNGWFVEPYAQIAAMTAGGANFTLDNGMTAQADRNASVQATLGVTVGKTFETSKGNFQPYARAAVVQEFVKNNMVRVNDIEFNNDLSGTRAEIALGLAAQMQPNLQAYLDTSYSIGKRLDKPWGVNVGVRYSF
ncbi:autotransporter outer membrane beta-barrel domain-containing protein [Pandoraea pneumonica]|uniref:autotransporter outer membrane beta-barrel domain-containing protein n=1 Tax=Pandoraea pneumonica TaxID=2508299 RepID=UPI003CF345D3